MTPYNEGYNAAIKDAVEAMVTSQLIPLMTPPDHPFFKLFFALKHTVASLERDGDNVDSTN